MPCACPSDTMIWIAMASNAHDAPDRRFVRTQRIQSNVQPGAPISGPEVYTVALRGRECQLRTMPTERYGYHPGTVRTPPPGSRPRMALPGVPDAQVFAKHSRLVRASKP